MPVTIKAEYHHSRGDFEAEQELLEKGFDALVLEGAEDDAENYTVLNAWFLLTTRFLMHFMRRIQTPKDELAGLAEEKGTKLYYTRKSNDRIAGIAPSSLLFAGTLLSFAMIGTGLQQGFTAVRTAVFLDGFSWIIGGIGTPLIILRLYNTFAARGTSNRDRKIAERVTDALDAGNKEVLVVTGAAHCPGVVEQLESMDIDVEVERPEYSFTSPLFYRDLALPGLEVFATFFGMYTGLILLLQWASTTFV
ncbi:MAG: hypothetical protein SVU32_04435 [Candidatus Nanohaloarchaea archaeon]|nr:hypothetical protein [Candidatus Nanohaloarchaea archaeon]